MNEEEIKVIDLFAGIGGFRLGLERASTRLRCVFSNEWDKYASSIYKRHFGECDTRDITTVDTCEIPNHDLLVGGFPCQAFSIAGKRRGFEDTRGTLFFEIARILRDKRPRYFLLENVKGLLSHDEGKTFQTILGVLSNLGYEYQWQVLNSKNFGVPQNRERVFIVGHLRGTSRPKVFPIGSNNAKTDDSRGQGEVSGTIDTGYAKNHRQSGATYIVPTIRATEYKHGDNQTVVAELKELTPKGTSQGYRVYETDGIASTIAGQAGGIGAKTGLYRVGVGIRRLTPTECERLQGFPDGWTEGISDTQRYKCLGNAVTVNVVEAIGTWFDN